MAIGNAKLSILGQEGVSALAKQEAQGELIGRMTACHRDQLSVNLWFVCTRGLREYTAHLGLKGIHS